MITNLKIKSLKSIPEKDITLKNLTLLAGLNNSGKSTVIQALRMFSDAANGKSPFLDGHGTFQEIRSNLVRKDQDIEIGIKGNESNDSLVISETAISQPSSKISLIYVGADRWGPRTFLSLHQGLDNLPQIGDKGDFVIDFIEKLSDIVIDKRLHHPNSQGETMTYELKGWLNEISPGVDFKFETNRKADISQNEFDGFRPTNVGFGLSYTLPIIAALLSAAVNTKESSGSEFANNWIHQKENTDLIVVLENPEAHLHPQGQTAMGKMIAMAASCGVQILLETHSDHLMDGIRIATKEGKCNSNDVIFHYLKKQDGETIFSSPSLLEDGKLDYWPEGFFDQTLKNRAILARKK
ncbi:hypothetical protein CS022_09845 [Veronia nyctiphanis]|uniref:DUF3696 domain-containing protein n=1 Tax=Veronia nyctiphanis TaxID=1278244 RepID=A0A4Q0YQH9_9GAMM|nr:DUF3696 domain-containing protein [Veronia nyctiphanis]RXJ73292.1 hypothetical protein CS022_09845 [Veronia nyctiphanis]